MQACAAERFRRREVGIGRQNSGNGAHTRSRAIPAAAQTPKTGGAREDGRAGRPDGRAPPAAQRARATTPAPGAAREGGASARGRGRVPPAGRGGDAFGCRRARPRARARPDAARKERLRESGRPDHRGAGPSGVLWRPLRSMHGVGLGARSRGGACRPHQQALATDPATPGRGDPRACATATHPRGQPPRTWRRRRRPPPRTRTPGGRSPPPVSALSAASQVWREAGLSVNWPSRFLRSPPPDGRRLPLVLAPHRTGRTPGTVPARARLEAPTDSKRSR